MRTTFVNKNLLFLIGFALLQLSNSCSNDPVPQPKPINPKQYDEQLIKANQYLKRKEESEIESLIKRKGWNMKTTSTGLRYEVLSKGSDKNIKAGDWVSLNYKLFLIDGTEIYNSEKDGKKEFEVATGKVENGLDEALQLLCYGDKARIIIPSHLGYGVVGDGKKIPGKATLIYEIEINPLNTKQK